MCAPPALCPIHGTSGHRQTAIHVYRIFFFRYRLGREDFTFTVLSDDFELSGPPGSQSITAPNNASLSDFLALKYDVTVTDPSYTILIVQAYGGNPVVSGGQSSSSCAGYGNNYIGTIPNPIGSPVQAAGGDLCQSDGAITQDFVDSSFSNEWLSSGYGDVGISLFAQDGGSASLSSADTSFIFVNEQVPRTCAACSCSPL